MSTPIEKVNFNNRIASIPPQSLRFVDHYEYVHGMKPLDINENFNNIIHSNPETNPENNTAVVKNLSALPAVMLSFLASTGLAITAHTTSLLDRFGDTVKGLLQFGLNATSVILGMITTETLFPFSKHNISEQK